MATVATISVNFAQISNANDFASTPTSVKSINPLTLAQFCLGTTGTSNLNYLGGFVKKTGDTMTGMLTLPSTMPSNENHSTRKGYVDSRVSSLSSSVNDTGNGFVRIAGSTMTGMLTLPATMPSDNNHSTRKGYVDARIDSLSATISDTTNGVGSIYLPKAGGTMSGQINMGNLNIVNLATPQQDNHAANKSYVDSRVSGGTQGFATLGYVNDELAKKVSKAGDTMTGNLTINNGNPTLGLRDNNHMPAFLHCDNNLFYILRNDQVDATSWDAGPNDRHPVTVNLSNGDTTFSRDVYVGVNSGGSWINRKVATEQYVLDVANTRLSLAGGTMTGFVTLHADPTNALHAATKGYIDNILTSSYGTIAYINQQDGTRVAKAGDTMSGNLTIRNGAPTIFFQDTDNKSSWIHVNSNIFYIGTSPNDTNRIGGTSETINGRWPLTIDLNNGNVVAAGDVTAYSDERLKKNIKSIENALDTTLKLKGVTFERLDSETRNLGMVAQQVKEVLPEAVIEDNDGYLSLAYGNIVGLLVEAIKELSSKVEKLEAKLNS